MAKPSKIKSCVILNPPTTPQEQEEYDKRFSKALARGLYRSLSPAEIDYLINCLRKEVQESKRKEAI